MQHGLDGAGHGVLVIERHGREDTGVRRRRPIVLHRADPPELACMIERDPLGLAGGARRVGQEGQVIAGNLRRLELRGCGHEGGLVIEPPVRRGRKREANRQIQRLGHAGHELVGARFDDGSAATGIRQRILDDLGTELRVERHRHDAGTHHAVHDLDELEAVSDTHGHAVAGLEALRRQQRSDPVQTVFDFGIGDLSRGLAGEIEHRHPARMLKRCLVGEVPEIVLPPGVEIQRPCLLPPNTLKRPGQRPWDHRGAPDARQYGCCRTA